MFNYDDDVWYIKPEDPSIEYDYCFSFIHISSQTLKKQIKHYFGHQMNLKRIALSSLARYCAALQHFSRFLGEEKLQVNYFEDLSTEIIEAYMYYLNATCTSSSSKIMAGAALKSIIRYGQFMELDHYPKRELFCGSMAKMFQHDDELKTKEITNYVLDQIDKALIIETNIYIKTLIAIARYTGVRISEALSIKQGAVIRDFMDKPLLMVYSYKNNKDRVIPIPEELVRFIQELEQYTSGYRNSDNRYLFLLIRNWKVTLYSQLLARNDLKNFIHRHGVKDEHGSIAEVTFHDFRHTVGSNGINSNLSPKEVMEMLGHESFHSTSLYAKVRNEKLDDDYRKIGFVGLTTREITANTIGVSYSRDKEIAGTLPDGVCKKAFEGSDSCNQFNKCLLCPKFITTPLYLSIHKKHLKRIQEDKLKYMKDSYICNMEKINRIEAALLAIISELEAL